MPTRGRLPMIRVIACLSCLLSLPHGATPGLAGANHVGLARSENFLVWADSPQLAEEILQHAENLRESIALRWFEEALPDGEGPASLNVYLSPRDRSRIWLSEDNSQGLHLVLIHTPRKLLQQALAHELTHVVLENRYRNLPSFAHEGAASLQDDRKRQEIRQDLLAGFVRSNRWPRVIRTLRAESIAPDDQTGYTVAVSVTEYLLQLAPNAPYRRFLEFAQSGGRHGNWDAALRQHYGIASVENLQRDWQQWVTIGRQVDSGSMIWQNKTSNHSP